MAYYLLNSIIFVVMLGSQKSEDFNLFIESYQ